MTKVGSYDLTLRDLRIFLAICEARSLSKAAARLNIAQPSLSRTVRSIEERFKLRLFDRHGRGLDLTPAGAVLRDHAEHILGSVQDLYTRLDDLHEKVNGSVSFLLLSSVSHKISPSFIKDLYAHFPEISINIFEENSNARIIERVASGDVDFGIFFDSTSRFYKNCEEIGTEDVYLVSLPDSGNTGDGRDPPHAAPIDFSEISGIPLILPRRSTPYRELLERLAEEHGVKLNIVREMEMSSTLLAFVLEGEGATILPLSHCQQFLRSGRVIARRIDNPRVTRRIMLIRSSTNPNKFVRSAIDILRNTLRSIDDDLSWEIFDSP